MATVYGGTVNNVWRSYLTYNNTVNNATTYTVTVLSGMNIPTAPYTSNRAFTSTITKSVNGGSASNVVSVTKAAQKYTGVVSVQVAPASGTSSVTITKTHSTQTLVLKAVLSGSGESTTSTASVTLSIGAKTKYTITYNANGGTGTMASGTKWHGEAFKAPACSFTKTDYSFTGWNTKADGSGTSYAVNASLPDASLTLYAQWKRNFIPPTISNVKIFRTASSSSSTNTGTGNYARITFDWKGGSADGGSTFRATKATIKIGSTTVTETLSGTSFAKNYGSYSDTSAYAVTITLADSDSAYASYTTIYTGQLPAAIFPIDILGNGQAMGIMTPAVSGQPVTTTNLKVTDDILITVDGTVTSLKAALSKSAMTACGNASDKSLTTTSAIIPMTTTRARVGPDLTIASNGVKCGKAGYVLVSAQGYFVSGFTANDLVHLVIKQDSTDIINCVYRSNGAYNYYNIAPQVRQVSNGTMFYLYAYNQTGARGTISNGAPTTLTIVYI